MESWMQFSVQAGNGEILIQRQMCKLNIMTPPVASLVESAAKRTHARTRHLP
jgi:hypothetical protein